MKTGMWLGLWAGTIAVIIIMPGIGGTTGHGQVWGRIPQGANGDDWYGTYPQGDETGLWTCVNTFSDSQTNEWTCGFSIKDLQYRDFSNGGEPDYKYYVKYMTIPWVAITWNSAGRILYPFDDSGSGHTMNNHIQYSDEDFSQGNLGQNPQLPTDMSAIYNLGIDQGTNVDFCFEIWYRLNVNSQTDEGDISMNIRVLQSPENWAVDGDTVTYIEFPFVFNPDVFDDESNFVFDIYTQQGQVNQEAGPLDTDENLDPCPCAAVWDGDAREIYMQTLDCGQSLGEWYALASHNDGQFSQYPTAYDNDESLSNTDLELWYIAGYDIPFNPPQGWVTVNYYNITGIPS